ncbi:MAG: hypothetical protein KKE44_14525 [Proteobacteria bacterium]|nr:hypothetical protein [Pseudomonadota bacterium]MBU1583942.1 hypothetical protein [Pseudomonadota bacterium]MBU2454964.1 hypothetical protein [Pseudomonadota bacterium]MBU2629502.1 hypothetical protein [Pseudomonadota bacterium]
MYYVYLIAGVVLLVSFAADPRKTKKGVFIAVTRFGKIIGALLVMLVLVSCLPFQVSVNEFFNIVGHKNTVIGILAASLLGSVMMLPGFIVFPFCGVLAQKGVPYFILSAFTTTMMMVGVVTYPVEKAYLGHKMAIIRNILGFGIALVVALVTGIVFGEIG